MVIPFPWAPEFLRCKDCRISESVLVTCRHSKLGRCEERRYKVYLIAQVLLYSFLQRDCTSFQLYDTEGNTVHIDNQIRSAVLSGQFINVAYFFRYCKVVGQRVVKVEQIYIFMMVFSIRLYCDMRC